MPYFLTAFMHAHPGVELEMDVTNKTKVIKSLEANEVDFSLVSILPEHLAVNHIDLLDNKLYLVGNRDAVLSEQVDLKMLFEQSPLIFREKGSGTRQSMEKFIAEQQLNVQKKMELTSNEAVKQAVLAGLGYSIMPLIGIRNELQSGAMKIIPVEGLPIHTVWQLIWLKGKNLSPVANAYLQHVEKEKEQIAGLYFSPSL
jgi:DNA-binding transcriptional LysR family regulator